MQPTNERLRRWGGGEPPPTPLGSFTLDGTEYDLYSFYIVDFGLNLAASAAAPPSGYHIDIWLAGLDVEFTVAGEPTGTGPALYIDLNSSNEGDVAEAVYYYTSSGTRYEGDFNAATVYTDYDFDAASGISFNYDGGTVDVTRGGDSYDFDISLTLTGGPTLTGSYTGTLDDSF